MMLTDNQAGGEKKNTSQTEQAKADAENYDETRQLDQEKLEEINMTLTFINKKVPVNLKHSLISDGPALLSPAQMSENDYNDYRSRYQPNAGIIQETSAEIKA